MSATVIKGCTCASPFQDRAYGAGMRVHNLATKEGRLRCTVCRSEKTGGGAATEPKATKKEKKK